MVGVSKVGTGAEALVKIKLPLSLSLRDQVDLAARKMVEEAGRRGFELFQLVKYMAQPHVRAELVEHALTKTSRNLAYRLKTERLRN